MDTVPIHQHGSGSLRKGGGSTGTTGTSGTSGTSGSNMPGLGTPGGKTAGTAFDTTKVTGNNGGTTAGGTTSGSGTKGTTFRTSYGQPGPGVKAPYKKGGYTAEELEAMGNKPRSDRKYNNGKNIYEGYYEWGGTYYPIDQVKANYYRANGGSYKGWTEGMRGYYNNYGTFYGYRPDWQTAGKGKSTSKKSGGGKSGSGDRMWYMGGKSSSSSSSSSGGYANPAPSGVSYGRGSTPNNGIYWNGNASWSIS